MANLDLVGSSSMRQSVPKLRTSRQLARPYARLEPAMKTKAGRLPSKPTLRVGAGLPIQCAHAHSEARKRSATHSPKTRIPASLRVAPIKPSPRRISGQSGGNDSNGRLFHSSLRLLICDRLSVFTRPATGVPRGSRSRRGGSLKIQSRPVRRQFRVRGSAVAFGTWCQA